jgi:hypothetical protein
VKLVRSGDWVIVILVFLAVLTGHFSSSNTDLSDSVWSIHTAMSIVKQGNIDLDEYSEIASETGLEYTLETVGGHTYTTYPIGASIVAVPFVFVADRLSKPIWGLDLDEYIKHTHPQRLESFVASFIVALTAALIFKIARLALDRPRSLLVVFIFAFCTSAWSTASRALWQQGPSMLMLTVSLYLILVARARPAWIQFAGIPLAFSYVIRPTNSISIVLLTVFVLAQYRRYFVQYLLWAMTIALPFVLLNLSIYHFPLSTYYRSYQDFSASTFLEALAGNLISPSRGLLVFSPVLLFSLWGIVLKARQRQPIDLYLAGILALHWITISTWFMWWGGWSFGPRIFADMIPYLVYFLIPAIAVIPTLKGTSKTAVIATLLGLTAISFFVHYRGANAREVTEWNALPEYVDGQPSRVWNWQDVQFLRGIKWSVRGGPADLSLSGAPLGRLDLDLAAFRRFGTNDLRAREFDATTSLIAPPGPTWVAIEPSSVGPEFASLFDGVTPQVSHWTVVDHRVYDLYYFDLGSRILEAAKQSEQTVFWSPDLYPAPTSTHQVNLPVRFGQTAELLGYRVLTLTQSSDLKVITYWRAGDQIAAPLRLFLHALSASGQIVAQQDLLDAPAEYWRPGDLVAQVSRITIPPGAGPVWIQIGLYNPESGERLPVMMDNRQVDTRLLLRQLEARP